MIDHQMQVKLQVPLADSQPPQGGTRTQFWLCVFSVETWNTAIEHNYIQAAFPEQKLRTARRIRPKDILFVYLLGERVVAGSLKAVSVAAFSETDSIFQPSGRFPVVLPTNAHLIIPNDKRLEMKNMVNKLSIFRGLKDRKKNWHHALRTSPRNLSALDGGRLEEEISKTINTNWRQEYVTENSKILS